jgi:UDP-N-acetylmuramate dehydrogenase
VTAQRPSPAPGAVPTGRPTAAPGAVPTGRPTAAPGAVPTDAGEPSPASVADLVWNPAADDAAVADLAQRLAAGGLPVHRDRPLGPLTTFGVGGSAAVFVDAVDDAALRRLMLELGSSPPDAVPLLVVGRGSNLLVADEGFPGVAVQLGRGFAELVIDGERVTAGAAVSMPQLAARTARAGLAGLEFAAAIPASVGGSVRMNAGAHGAEIRDRLAGAELALPGEAEPARLSGAQLRLGYRSSRLPPGAVVTAATFRLSRDDPAAVAARLAEHRAWRRATQPLRARSCGSTFTNPAGTSAGRVIEAAGLKGRSVGGARVSEKHANFIVVEPGARALDVLRLIDLVRAEVLRQGGPDLVPEVRAVGRFGAAAPQM